MFCGGQLIFGGRPTAAKGDTDVYAATALTATDAASLGDKLAAQLGLTSSVETSGQQQGGGGGEGARALGLLMRAVQEVLCTEGESVCARARVCVRVCVACGADWIG